MQPCRLRLCRPHFAPTVRRDEQPCRLSVSGQPEQGPFQLLYATRHRETLKQPRQAFRAFTRLAFGRAATRRK